MTNSQGRIFESQLTTPHEVPSRTHCLADITGTPRSCPCCPTATMNPSRSHGRLLRLVSSSLSRATPPINHCSSTSRTHLLASRAVASKHRQWKTCILRSNSRFNPEPTSHYPRQAGCRLYSSSIEQAPGPPEMPDHLDEKEKAIFRKLTDGLQPTALEVRSCCGR